jgi:hypothetical protein
MPRDKDGMLQFWLWSEAGYVASAIVPVAGRASQRKAYCQDLARIVLTGHLLLVKKTGI